MIRSTAQENVKHFINNNYYLLVVQIIVQFFVLGLFVVPFGVFVERLGVDFLHVQHHVVLLLGTVRAVPAFVSFVFAAFFSLMAFQGTARFVRFRAFSAFHRWKNR